VQDEVEVPGYWQRYRLRRRRFLGALAGFAGTALPVALLACNSADDGPLPQLRPEAPVDSTSRAQAGGTLKTAVPAEVTNLDPLASGSSLTFSLAAAYTYPRLLKFTTALYPENASGSVEGDLAESFELSPDRLQLTFRLRPGPRWDARAPTSGRAIEARDAVFSWNKFAQFSPMRGDVAYHADTAPGGPVEAVSSPDPQTVVLRLKYVDASVLGLLASERHLYVMPTESAGGFDPRTEARGYGPWLLTDSRPGLRRWTRAPEYHVKGRPFIDRIEAETIADYPARLAHFKAGEVYTSVASQDDILSVLRDQPSLVLRKADTFATSAGSVAFGYNEAPWRDERVRQAVSHLIDRETLIDIRSNRQRFADAGLDVEIRYHTAVAAGWEGYWLDPRDEGSFGPGARYFRFDPAEARRLLGASGFGSTIETSLHHNAGNEYGPGYTRSAELLSGMLRAGGVNATLVPHEFQSDWTPNYHLGYASVAHGGRQLAGFSGLVYRSFGSQPAPSTQMYASLHHNGNRFVGLSPDGKSPQQGDPDLNRMLEEARREFELRKQQALLQDAARLVARRAYDLPFLPFTALNYTLTWPVVGNVGVFRGWPGGAAAAETSVNLWLDTTKAPIGAGPK
jgi:peptide/nickel transport system substrate-binding protein